MSETKVTLEYPIKADGRIISEISLRRPKVKDQIVAEKAADNGPEREITILANLSGLTPNDIQELDVADYARVQEVFENFLPAKFRTFAKR